MLVFIYSNSNDSLLLLKSSEIGINKNGFQYTLITPHCLQQPPKSLEFTWKIIISIIFLLAYESNNAVSLSGLIFVWFARALYKHHQQ